MIQLQKMELVFGHMEHRTPTDRRTDRRDSSNSYLDIKRKYNLLLSKEIFEIYFVRKLRL